MGIKSSQEQDRNCQADPGSVPWCVLDQPWASASARIGLEAAAQGPGQHGRFLLCTSPFPQELQVPSEAGPLMLGTWHRRPTKQIGSLKLKTGEIYGALN